MKKIATVLLLTLSLSVLGITFATAASGPVVKEVLSNFTGTVTPTALADCFGPDGITPYQTLAFNGKLPATGSTPTTFNGNLKLNVSTTTNLVTFRGIGQGTVTLLRGSPAMTIYKGTLNFVLVAISATDFLARGFTLANTYTNNMPNGGKLFANFDFGIHDNGDNTFDVSGSFGDQGSPLAHDYSATWNGTKCV